MRMALHRSSRTSARRRRVAEEFDGTKYLPALTIQTTTTAQHFNKSETCGENEAVRVVVKLLLVGDNKLTPIDNGSF